MSNTIESRGRTVEEAISEALLRLGLRRDEVDVTVLQQPKSGFLGLIGGKPAVVRVEKKGGRGDRAARGRRDESRRENTGGRGRSQEARRDDSRHDDTRSSRGGRGRPRRDDGRQASSADSNERGERGRGRGDRDRDKPAAATAPAAARVDSGTNADQGEERSRSSRRRRRRPRRRDDARPDEGRRDDERRDARENESPVNRLAEVETAENLVEPVVDTLRTARATGATMPEFLSESPTTGPSPSPSLPIPADSTPADSTPQDTSPPAEAARGAAAVVAGEIAAIDRVKPYDSSAAAEVPAFLQQVTTDLMRFAGFPCRCEVREDEYAQVKLITDDRSAGVLIGRHGMSVDAIEILVERIASHAVGDRVKMNLDINNYRRRCDEQLVQMTRGIIREVKDSGEPVHLEPMGSRERRIVHLQVQEVASLTTYTVADGASKHVVVAPQSYDFQVEGAVAHDNADETHGGDSDHEDRAGMDADDQS